MNNMLNDKTKLEQFLKANSTLTMAEVAKILGCTRATLYTRIKELKIDTGRKAGRKKGWRKTLNIINNP